MTIFKWLSVNKLSLNEKKTEFLLFDSVDQHDELTIECNEVTFTIKECKETKYLGLILDSKLNFKSHVDNNNNNNNALFIYRLGRISDQSPRNGVDTGHQSGADKYN